METMREILASAMSLASWRTLALILAVINLKSLPFVWHFRLLYHVLRNVRLKPSAPFLSKGVAAVDAQGKPTHPLFVPSMVTSRTPLLETDYNLHKSNSTYFTDLDVSRTALVSRIYSPGVGLISKELDREFLAASKKAGKPAPRRKPVLIVLGSVYCTFKREIKPFELYEMHSKVISWDKKWIKYVVKKGRLTVPPERILRTGGFLPAPPPEIEGKTALADSSAETSGDETPGNGEGITATGDVDGPLVQEVLKLNDDQIPGQEALEKQQQENTDSWSAKEWTWERIEQERLRGLKVVDGYTDLDNKLIDEWAV
ncbi:uncharacterized protein N7515_004809 [Penicillium bovifimosum]|uniref:Uncharacterized protein n=1 Tax=Penicillium bovifimosum TaxID=126998 RepID=A0A9W9H290_9EURO|nr:uncharacterized protein N7515_004809 [Penicillium bovifimosum]KAJ5135531.1 hypothetical protein N7515_004809 [Penicillium bovifimosum]